jgi:hypothetical protein
MSTLQADGAEDRALPGGNLSADSGAKTRLGFGEAADCDSANFVDVAEKWSGITATSNKPVFQRVGGPVGGIPQPVLATKQTE